MKVAVLGAGAWGTAMAAIVASRTATTLWARDPRLAEAMASAGRNRRYLPDLALPASLRVTADLAVALEDCDLVVLAVPSHGVRAVVGAARLAPELGVVSLAKGLEEGSLLRVSEVVTQVAGPRPTAVLTGPNLVNEIVAGHPTASVVASADADLAAMVQELVATEALRTYTSDDLVGCELGGALKNVFAVAVGLADGMGYGDNTRAALITRSLAELARLGTALGGRASTFAGLAGMGDLVATCTSRHSRNRALGERVARGGEPTASDPGSGVAEGYRTCLATVALAARHQVEMPVAEQVVAVLHHGRPVGQVVAALMGRAHRPEEDPRETPDSVVGARVTHP
ncbi:MAG: NAD(P)H-dependent glycerol-3-phosphate dehydrogenase [Acidimicrobiales bacterium]